MKEEIIGFVNDIKDLDLKQQSKRIHDFVEMQIENFILWNYGDELRRAKELEALKVWLEVMKNENLHNNTTL